MALVDDFSTTDTSKWTFDSNATVSAGQLRLSNPNTVTYAGITSASAQNFTGSVAGAQLVTVPSAGSGNSVESYIKVMQTGNAGNYYTFGFSGGGDFTAYAYNSSSPTNVYDKGSAPTAGTYMRIRESGGTTFFETSTDSRTWTSVGSITNPWAVTSMTYQILIGHFGSDNSTVTTAVWDNFNITAASSSDTGSGAESAVVQTATPISASDTGTSTDAIASYAPSATDSGSAAEAVPAASKTGTEVVALADAVSLALKTAADTAAGVDAASPVASRTLTETVTATEAAIVALPFFSSDTGSVSDAVTLIAMAAGDAGTTADSLVLAASASVADTASSVEGVPAAAKQVTETIASVEGRQATYTQGPTSEPVGLSDAYAVVSGFTRNPSDAAVLSDAVQFDFGCAVTDTLLPTDALGFGYGRTLADTSSLTDTATTAAGEALSTVDTTGLAESVAVAVSVVSTDPTGLADDATRLLGRPVGDDTGLADTAVPAAGFNPPALSDGTGLGDQATTTAFLDRPLAVQPTGLSDAGVSFEYGYATSADDGIGLLESLSFALEAPHQDTTGLTDGVLVVSTFSPAVADGTGMQDSAMGVYGGVRRPSDGVGLTDAVTFDLVVPPGVDFTLAVQDTSALIDSWRFGFLKSVLDSAGYTDAASALRDAGGSDTGTVADAATTTKVPLDFHRVALMVDVYEDDPVMRVGVHRGS